LKLCRENDGFFFVGPLYHLRIYPDGKHYFGVESRILHAMIGIARYHVLIAQQQPPWLRSGEPIWNHGEILIPLYPPSGKVVIDTVSVTDPGNLGFALVDHLAAPVPITDIALRGNTLAIKHDGGDLLDGTRLGYAEGDTSMTTAGPTAGPRGCIRDTQGDYINLWDHPFHNRLPCQAWIKG